MTRIYKSIKTLLWTLFLTAGFAIGMTFAEDLDKGLSALKAKNFEKAYNELMPLAKEGNDKAQYNIARMYSKGDYVPKNLSKALEWYRKAAEQGHEKALNNLGAAYYLGKGVKKNNQIAYMFFGVAAELMHERSKKNLLIVAKELTKGDLEKAKNMVKICVNQSFVDCEKIKP